MAKKPRTESVQPAALGALADALARAGIAASTPAPISTPPVAATDLDLGRAAKIVLRREMKGRGGKTVTVIAGLQLPPAALARAARELRKALGCGSTVEDDRIVLQGDMTERAQAWLAARGATRIVVGN